MEMVVTVVTEEMEEAVAEVETEETVVAEGAVEMVGTVKGRVQLPLRSPRAPQHRDV